MVMSTTTIHCKFSGTKTVYYDVKSSAKTRTILVQQQNRALDIHCTSEILGQERGTVDRTGPKEGVHGWSGVDEVDVGIAMNPPAIELTLGAMHTAT
jgi:hypothetical protein